MKDRLKLIGVALILAPLCWAFWHFLGQNAFQVITLICLLVVGADNFRLRRQMRALRTPHESEPPAQNE